VTIDTLTDDALLEIFDFCRAIGTSKLEKDEMEDPMWWETLVHVCQRWRKIIFASPRHLDLHVTCSGTTQTRTSLDIWPPFPIKIAWYQPRICESDKEYENIIAALEHHDRIDEILFSSVTRSTLKRFVTAMQEPLVALTNLRIESSILEWRGIVLPEAFFSVSAPSLRSFSSSGISFPSFPSFITSARDLVDLHLEYIPTSECTAPEVIVASLTALPNLKQLSIGFDYDPQHRPILGNPPPPSRAVFPALTFFSFDGINKYLEDLVARIDTPLLNKLHLTFRDPIRHTYQLYQFSARTESVKLFTRAHVVFYGPSRKIILEGPNFDLEVYCSEFAASMMWRVHRRFSSLIACVERLDVRSTHSTLAIPGDLTPAQLLELFRQFSAVQSLYVSANMNRLVVSALNKSTGDMAKKVLPALREVFLERLEPSGSLWEGIQQFVTARQHSDHPVAIDIQSWGDIYNIESDGYASEDGSSIEDEDVDGSEPDDDEPYHNSPGESALNN